MSEEKHIPIAISGWSGVGTSTVALQVAWVWQRKYYYFGKLFRDLGEKIGYQNEGMDRVKADDYLEKIIGKTVDKYVDFLLLSGRNIVVESDIACFRLKKKKEFL